MKKNEISFLNVLFCLIVIFIHVCSEPVSELTRGSFSHFAIYTLWKLSGFVVQGFIFLSGLKLFLSQKKTSYKSYIRSRFSRIYYPYVLAVCIYYLYFYFCNYFGFSLFDLGSYILKGDLSAQFYFVVVIMQFYLLKPLWTGAVSNIPKSALIILSLIITILGATTLSGVFGTFNDRVFTTYLIYWILGCIAGRGYEKFSGHVSRHRKIIVLPFLAVAVFEVVFSYFDILPYYLLEILHIAYCSLAILFCMLVSQSISERFMKKRVFRLINASSYYIYLWHVLSIFVVNQAMDMSGVTAIGTRFIIRFATVYMINILLCGAYVKIKNRIRG